MRRAFSVRPLRWLALAVLWTGCDDATGPPHADLIERFSLRALGPTPYPGDNPATPARIELGRLLFYDPILGGELDVSCATCHHPEFGFADGRRLPAGVGGSGLGPARTPGVSSVTGAPIGPVPRNSPTVMNAALNADASGAPSATGHQFWDGRAAGLEAQATLPIAVRAEMAGDAYPPEEAADSVVARLRANAEYVALFRAAFPEEAAKASGGEVITMDTYGRAVAAFERELVGRETPFDRFVAGERDALSAAQKAGLELFFTRARCAECHSGPMFSDFSFRVLGVPQAGPGLPGTPGDDTGRAAHTGSPADRYAFRTPSLRNASLTGPYMHDGVFETLEQVVRFYNLGAQPRHSAVDNGLLDPLLREPLGLSEREVAEIVAFLGAFTDPGTDLPVDLLRVPTAVPSGLVPVFGLSDPTNLQSKP